MSEHLTPENIVRKPIIFDKESRNALSKIGYTITTLSGKSVSELSKDRYFPWINYINVPEECLKQETYPTEVAFLGGQLYLPPSEKITPSSHYNNLRMNCTQRGLSLSHNRNVSYGSFRDWIEIFFKSGLGFRDDENLKEIILQVDSCLGWNMFMFPGRSSFTVCAYSENWDPKQDDMIAKAKGITLKPNTFDQLNYQSGFLIRPPYMQQKAII